MQTSSRYMRSNKKKTLIFSIDAFTNLYFALFKCDRNNYMVLEKYDFVLKKTFKKFLWLIKTSTKYRVNHFKVSYVSKEKKHKKIQI